MGDMFAGQHPEEHAPAGFGRIEPGVNVGAPARTFAEFQRDLHERLGIGNPEKPGEGTSQGHRAQIEAYASSGDVAAKVKQQEAELPRIESIDKRLGEMHGRQAEIIHQLAEVHKEGDPADHGGHPEQGVTQLNRVISHDEVARRVNNMMDRLEESKKAVQSANVQSPPRSGVALSAEAIHADAKAQLRVHLDRVAAIRKQSEDEERQHVKGHNKLRPLKGREPLPQGAWDPASPRVAQDRLERLLLGPDGARRSPRDLRGNIYFLRVREDKYREKTELASRLRRNHKAQQALGGLDPAQRRRRKVELHNEERELRQHVEQVHRDMDYAEHVEGKLQLQAEEEYQNRLTSLKEDRRKHRKEEALQRKKEARSKKRKEKKEKDTGAGAPPAGTGAPGGERGEGSPKGEGSEKGSHSPSKEVEDQRQRMGRLKITDPQERTAAQGVQRQESPKGPQDKQTQADLQEKPPPKEVQSQHAQTDAQEQPPPKEFKDQHTQTEPQGDLRGDDAQDKQTKKQRKKAKQKEKKDDERKDSQDP